MNDLTFLRDCGIKYHIKQNGNFGVLINFVFGENCDFGLKTIPDLEILVKEDEYEHYFSYMFDDNCCENPCMCVSFCDESQSRKRNRYEFENANENNGKKEEMSDFYVLLEERFSKLRLCHIMHAFNIYIDCIQSVLK